MGAAQGRDHLVVARRREDRLEPELRDTLFPARLTDRWRSALAAEERAGARGVPGAALVVADPPGAGLEERVADGVERLLRHEDDELSLLSVHVCTPPGAGTAAPWPRSRSSPVPRPRSARRRPSRSRWTRPCPFTPRRSRTGPRPARAGSSPSATDTTSGARTTSRPSSCS